MAKKKSVDPQPLALEALAQALADPAPKVLLGSATNPGFFKGATQATKAAARLCEERRWVEGIGQWVGKGTSKKQMYRLTPAGIRAVLEHSETLALLRSLSAALQQQVEHFRSMRDHLGLLVEQFQPLTETIAQLAERIEPPDVEQICRQLNSAADRPAPPATPHRQAEPAADPGWLDEVVRLVTEQRQRDRYQPLTLPQLYASIRKRWPLTLGQFHDGLRTLRDHGRIRLSPYTRALATIDDPRNALFLDGEVMYHAELP